VKDYYLSFDVVPISGSSLVDVCGWSSRRRNRKKESDFRSICFFLFTLEHSPPSSKRQNQNYSNGKIIVSLSKIFTNRVVSDKLDEQLNPDVMNKTLQHLSIEREKKIKKKKTESSTSIVRI